MTRTPIDARGRSPTASTERPSRLGRALAALAVSLAVSLPAVAHAQCRPGQAISIDTEGNCCWPGQVWSRGRNACAGVPMCPVGFVAMNGDCFATTFGAPAETSATSFEAAQNRGASGQGVHRHLAATGDDYAWYTAGHLMFGAALMVPPESPGPSVLFGGSIEGNIPLTALINRPGFALHLGLDLVGRIVGGSNNGLQLYQVPQMAGGLNLGFATDSGWLHLHAGGGFAVNLSATTAGGARAAVVPLGDVGLRFGVHVSHHSINRFDILSICGSGSLLFGEGDGVLPVFAVGVCL